MCRLFGFRSVLDSGVHTSLMNTENALVLQSEKHPDGWGVAYYLAGIPHLIKSTDPAIDDRLFKKVSGIVSSQTVLAHLRKATIGDMSSINTHPFQHGPWSFGHNGNLKNHSKLAERLLAKISPSLRKFVLGTTDSEAIFYLFLTHLDSVASIYSPLIPYPFLLDACKKTVTDVVELFGMYNKNDAAPPTENFLTFVLTNGSSMLAHQGGKSLFYSTHKRSCPERDSCKYFAKSCESPRKDGAVNHLLFSSEPLGGENVWTEMPPGQIIGVDQEMQIQFDSFDPESA